MFNWTGKIMVWSTISHTQVLITIAAIQEQCHKTAKTAQTFKCINQAFLIKFKCTHSNRRKDEKHNRILFKIILWQFGLNQEREIYFPADYLPEGERNLHVKCVEFL